MPNVLEFALGIETGGWIAGLEAGGHKLVEFLSIAEAGKFIIESFTGAISEGGQIFQKSFATGNSTGSLYQLEEAFKAVGLQAADVETTSSRIQRALSGVSDAGERTELAFGKLGLNMRAMRSLDPAHQILSLSDAFQKLDSNAQTGVASILFGGRGNSASFLQLARQGEQFRDAFAKAKQDADTFQKLGGLFSNLLTTVGEISSHLKAGFAEAAAGFIVPLQKALNLLEKIPWNKIGQDAAIVFNSIFEVFKNGEVGMLLGDSIRLGMEVGALFIIPFFKRLFIETENFGDFLTITLMGAFEDISVLFSSLLIKGAEEAAAAIGKLPGLGKLFGLSNYKPQDFKDIVGDQAFAQETARQDLNDAMNADHKRRADASNKELASASKKAADLWNDFVKNHKNFLKAPKIKGPQSHDQHGHNNPLFAPKRENVNQYEKIGFILNSVAAMSGDHARQTAKNTAEAIPLLREIRNRLGDTGGDRLWHHPA